MSSPFNTVVKNTSGKTLSFGFLGAHGVRLTPDEVYEHSGNLLAQVAQNQRQSRALQAALDDELLAILSSPELVVLDTNSNEPAVLTLDTGVVAAAAVPWASPPGSPP